MSISASKKYPTFHVAMSHVAFVITVLGFFIWSSMAHGYAWQQCKNRKQIFKIGGERMRISTTSMPIGSVWDSKLQNAMWRWNNVKGSKFLFYVGRDTGGDHREWNGKSEIYFDTFGGSDVARTRVLTRCFWLGTWQYGIYESDIEFNTNYSWTTGTIDYNSVQNPNSFEGVALHELGHALGLIHENRRLATMNANTPNSGPVGHDKTWDVLPDDRAGVRFLYPNSTTETDIAGSVFRRTTPGNSDIVASTPGTSRGGSAVIQFTFHNMSTSSQNFNIGFYLSTNDFISRADRLLGTNTASAPIGSSGTFTRTVNIPNNINPGRYWLGFIVDHDSRISESSETNNSMEMPRSIQIN